MEPVTLIPALPSAGAIAGPSRLPINQQVIFDFTKRKRWADLLVTELTEAVIFVLSSTAQVWFCSPAIEELLGWKDEEVIDGGLAEIMNEEDRPNFQRQFDESIRTRTDLLSYVRLLCKTDNDLYPNIPVPIQAHSGQATPEYAQVPTRRPAPKEVLFEIKGYAHYVESSDFDSDAPSGVFTGVSGSGSSGTVDVGTGEVFKCFFAMARPYPSRNTAMLNTFLELKVENERLQQRRDAALARLEMQKRAKQAQAVQSQSHFRASSYSYPFAEQPTQSGYDAGAMYPYEDRSPVASGSSGKGKATPAQEDSDEHGAPRKKVKRSMGPEQHVCVTCGRTDSPEWRKGPLGPKTLCNACGLRWAKTVRRDPAAAEAAADTQVESANTVGGMGGVASSSVSDLRAMGGGYNY